MESNNDTNEDTLQNNSELGLLEAFKMVMPYLPDFFEDEISVALTDTKQFLVNQACNSIPLKAGHGDPIPQNGAGYKAITTKQTIVQEVPKEVYGVPFKSYAVPLKKADGEVVGAVMLARNIERSKKLSQIAQKMAQTYKQVNDASCLLLSEIQDLANINQEILSKSITATEQTHGTTEILKFIEKISTQSNLLGLNASIEAARAGEAGRGFQVVAEEIRKMSLNTSDSIKKISHVLADISLSIQDISSGMTNSNEMFQKQLSVLEEITTSFEEMDKSVHDIEDMSQKI
jgi:RNase P/RNase MRP subunit p29